LVTDAQRAAQFERLGVASSIVVPLCTSSGVLLGAMTWIRALNEITLYVRP
jgi:ABC-type sulfate transport system permease component